MTELLRSLGLSEGIAETIKWWIPYLSFIMIIIIFTVLIRVIRKKKKS
ncbi:hypothetical protein ACIQXF_16675 [Lysinibacillus sp. NPDC097231]